MSGESMIGFEIFNNEEFGQVRWTMIEGYPYFVAKDVSDSLGYTNSREALRKHVDPDYILVSRFVTRAGEREFSVISEAGLYSLILRSNKPIAKKFAKWVTSEVLPSIRKYGMYITEEKLNLKNEELMKEVEEYKERSERNRDVAKATFDYFMNTMYAAVLSDSVLARLSAEFGISIEKIFNFAHDRFLIEFGEPGSSKELPYPIAWRIADDLVDGYYTADIKKEEKNAYGEKTGKKYLYRQFTENAYDLIKDELISCGYKPKLNIPTSDILKEAEKNILHLNPKDFIIALDRPKVS